MLLLRERIRRATLGALVLAVAACSTDPLAPAGRQVSAASAAVQAGSTSIDKSSGVSLVSVKAAGRLRPASQDVVVGQVIGAAGGTISMPSHGLTLIVPPGAVDGPTHFQVKALAGRAVAYEFEPHGTRFKVPLVFRQSVVHTSVGWGQVVRGAYFSSAAQIDQNSGRAMVSEVLPANVKAGSIEFLIWHFSGYLVSCA